MCRVQAAPQLASPALTASLRWRGPCPPAAGPLRPVAAASSQAQATCAQGVQTVREASNILPSSPLGRPASLSRREELEAQARALLEQDSRWHEAGERPANMVVAGSPKEFKQLIVGASPGQLIIVEYFAPHCNGCRMLYNKVRQIASNNADCVFVQVNTDLEEMRTLAMNMGVTKLPYFQLWRDCDVVTSFTANVTTVSVLRAEIASHKTCTDPGCAL